MRGSGGISLLFLTSAQHGDAWSALGPDRFTPGEITPPPQVPTG
jgi:hypothetical protein